MGGCSSALCRSTQGEQCSCSQRRGWGGAASGKTSLGRNLSAAFSVVATSDEDDASLRAPDKLNVNTATEEELMTLPCINRATARNIVDYRRQIGGFRRVEDMALVTGVGAARLDQMRHEICVNSGFGGGGSSVKVSLSGTPSGSSAQLDAAGGGPTPASGASRRPNGAAARPRVDVNVANVFQLMRIKGLGLTVAQHIVDYRAKRGPFETADTLLKVKGVTPALLGSIRHQIVVEASERSSCAGDRLSNSDSGVVALPARSGGSSAPGGGVPGGGSGNARGAGKKNSDDLSSASLGSADGGVPFGTVPVPAVTGWQRQRVAPPVLVKEGGRAVVRVATWNLQQCSEDKIGNPGVLEVVCMTVLENGFGIVAFQELGSAAVLERVRDELNCPTLPTTAAWGHRRGRWEAVTSKAVGRMFQSVEYNGFLYDVQQGVTLGESGLLEPSPGDASAPAASAATAPGAHGDHTVLLVRRPFCGVFEVGKINFSLMSVHLKSAGLASSASGAAADVTREEVAAVARLLLAKQRSGGGAVLVVGDFNLSADKAEFDAFRKMGYVNLVPANLPTNVSSKNSAGTQSYDNLWASKALHPAHTGSHGVVRAGLTSPWIPNGWSWGGVVSDHCPTWAELYSDRQSDLADVAATALRQLSL